MKKFLLTLLAILLIVGTLGGVGFAGYQFGYAQGRRAVASNTTKIQPSVPNIPNNNFRFGPMPLPFGRNFDRGFRRGFGPGGFGMMPFGRGFGFFGVFGM